MAKVGSVKLPGLHRDLSDVFKAMLKGQPLRDKMGEIVRDKNGEVIMEWPSAGVLREVRQFLADNGIDQEPVEGAEVLEVAKAIKQYDDEEDPFLIEHQ